MLKNLLKKNKIIYNFILKGKFQYLIKIEKIKNVYYKIKNKKKILEYQNFKKNRIPIGVIYTCIIGNYDSLKMHKHINFYWDYICYTDNKNIISDGVWEIKPLEFDKLDNTRNNRWHKLNPHLILQKYQKSLYIDGNVRILSKDFYELLNQKNFFISAIHPKRKCLYEEAERCKEAKLEEEKIITKQIEMIKKMGFPKNYGLYEANILYRYHNEKNIIKMDEEWWEIVLNQARRDQLSLTYVCWKNNIPFKTFFNTSFRYKNKYIEITPHLIKKVKK